MANTSSKSTATKATQSAKTSELIEKEDGNSEIEKLREENNEIKEQLKQLMAMLTETKVKEGKSKMSVTAVEVLEGSEPIPDEPSPNKMVRILSLCRGSLNLSEDEAGNGKVKFSKYGEIKTVLYSSLINIVNYNRSFAEKGVFYILDKAAVYYLGLKDCYSHLVTNDVLDNICNYDDVDIIKIIDSTEKTQIDTMIKNLTDRLYSMESLDLNKIQTISQKVGVDIMAKVNEMKQFSNMK
nr:MAG TPA: Cby-like protein [Caudoviricetes sp.]DAT69697.1 MAG TPA: Cby-like protein [Caudoviricetes sp.]